jgi:hypothetical protein
MRRLLVTGLWLAFLAACQPAATELTEEQKLAIAEEVNEVNAEFFDVWSQADWERGMTYYYNSPETVWATEGTLDYGYSEIDAKYRPTFAGVASQIFTITDSRTTVLAPTVASFTANIAWSRTDTTGVTGPEMKIAWTAIWVLREGEWKVQTAHVSMPTQ